jgi:L-fuconolactonase
MNGKYLRSVGSLAILVGGLLGTIAVSCTDTIAPYTPAKVDGGGSSSGGDGGSGSGSGSSSGAGDGGGSSSGAMLDPRTTMLLAKANGVAKPIADTHVHLYQPSRSGVAWPPSANTTIYKDFLPQPYMDMGTLLGILGSGIVEASPWNDDTQWVLAQTAATPMLKSYFPWYVAQLDITSADFVRDLTAYLKVDPMANPDADKVVGLRVYLWSGGNSIDPTDAIQKANLDEVQRLGLTLDIISRGTPPNELNPKAKVVALATAYPGIRIIIDHMAGAKIPAAVPPPTWMADITSLAALPNIFIKWSAFFDAANMTGDESKPWIAPKDMASYQGIFDTLFTKFGEDRLIWGSNYPVCLLAGTVQEELTIAEAYLATKTATNPLARDKMMFKNAILFYRRIPGWTPPAGGDAGAGDAGAPLDAKTMALLALATGKVKPVMDSHQHQYMPSRSGVAWPPSANTTLYHDYVPKMCMALSPKATCGPAYADEIAGAGSVLLTNVVEASPRNNNATGPGDTDWVLSQINGNTQFFNYAAQLDISSKDFIKNLDANAEGMTADMVDRHAMVSGLRVYLWSGGKIDPTDPVQKANLTEVQKRGMTLDIISRGTPPNETNPKAGVVALAKAFPKIRVIIDHMAGAKIAAAMPNPTWMADIASLAAQPNIYVKMSAFFDAANATGDESMPWMAPKTVDMYTPIFDALLAAFGEDRLIWGSNWPVVKLAGTIAEEITIAETWLATKTSAQRDKIMFKNAILFYRRVP